MREMSGEHARPPRRTRRDAVFIARALSPMCPRACVKRYACARPCVRARVRDRGCASALLLRVRHAYMLDTLSHLAREGTDSVRRMRPILQSSSEIQRCALRARLHY